MVLVGDPRLKKNFVTCKETAQPASGTEGQNVTHKFSVLRGSPLTMDEKGKYLGLRKKSLKILLLEKVPWR